MPYETYTLDLEKLSNEARRNVDKEIDKFIKGEISKQVLLATILVITSTYIGYANTEAYSINKLTPSDIVITKPDFVINSKTFQQRIDNYIDDLFILRQRFVTRYGESELLSGIEIFQDPRWMQLENVYHAEQIQAGIKTKQSSPRIRYNINQTVGGEIFIAGNYFNSELIRFSGRGIIVKNQEDSKVCAQCKAMSGLYPAEYIFVGWHTKCRCYVTPTETLAGNIPQSALEYMSETKHQFWFRNSLFLTLNRNYYE